MAPAGDEGAGAAIVNYPAAYPGVISVGAFDQNFTKASYSSREPYVTMTAAGDGVAAESPAGYTTISSTGAASAVVAGIAALIRSAFPALPPAQVSKALISSTRFRRPDGRQIGSGYGTADAQRALRAATAMAEPRGQRAYTGSAARVAPVTPAVQVTQPGLRSKLERDAVISLGVLLILLLPAMVLAFVRWRRTRDEADSGRADDYDDLERRLANTGAGVAERMEFLPSPSAGAGRYGAAGPGSPYGSLGADERLAGAGTAGGPGAFAGAGGYLAAATPFGTASPRPGPAAGSLWDAAAASARAAALGSAQSPAAGAADLPEDAAAGSSQDADPASDPMYGWSQTETTETFPAIGEDDES